MGMGRGQDVKITISAEDKTRRGVESAQSGFHKFASTLNDTVKSLTGFSIAQVGTIGAITGAINQARKAVEEYSSYVEAVDKMSMSTGMAAEETSRLIQLADDFRVEQGSLENAMKLALQNGFEPTIENLAQLSDEYLAIGSVTERAEKMQKIFGRSWEELVPLLQRGGDAIRSAAAGIGDGLVVTDEAIKANREYVKSLDDLNDSWTELKYSITRDAIPALADWMSLASKSIELQKEGVSRSEWMAKMEREKALATYESSDAAKAYAERLTAQAEATSEATRATKRAAVQVHELGMEEEFSSEQGSSFTYILRDQKEALEKSRAQAEKYKSELEKMRGATEDLLAAQENFNESFGDKVVSSLERAGVSGAKLEEVYAALDERYGTQYLATYKADQALDGYVQQLESGKITSEEFATKIDSEVKPAFEKLDEDLQNAITSFKSAQTAWNNFITAIANANGMEVTIHVDVVRDYVGGRETPTPRPACFVAETPVNVPGGYKAIGDLAPGDEILVKEDAGAVVTALVTGIRRASRDDLYTVRTAGGLVFHCSPEHPFKTARGFIYAFLLRVGDELITLAGTDVVREVVEYPGIHQVFDVSVDHPEHTFLVSGVVVHNKEAPSEGATGLSTVVPYAPYSNGESYVFRAHPGETVNIIPPGTPGLTTGGGGATVNVNQYNTVASPAQLEALVAETTRRVLDAVSGRR